eukprot:2767828-Prymnesium_polylepis.1
MGDGAAKLVKVVGARSHEVHGAPGWLSGSLKLRGLPARLERECHDGFLARSAQAFLSVG